LGLGRKRVGREAEECGHYLHAARYARRDVALAFSKVNLLGSA